MRQYLDAYVIVVCILVALLQFALWRHFNRRPGTEAHSNAVRAMKTAAVVMVPALLATAFWAPQRYDVVIYAVFGLLWLPLASFLMWFVFAATDTSMHVHLLVETFGREPLSRSELRSHYNKRHIIESRVPRLLALGQLTNTDGRLRLTGQAVLHGAWIAMMARRTLGLPLRPPREAEPLEPAVQEVRQRMGAAWQRLPGLPFLSFGVWLYFYLPRVWSFGFYNGDWWDLAIARPWDYIAYTFWSRPISIPFFYWLPQVIGYRPWVWQLMLALSMLLSAWLMYRVFARLRGLLLGVGESRRYRLGPDLSVAAFLLFPWTFGWSAWPTILGMGTIGLVYFLASLFYLFSPSSTRRSMWLSVFFYALAMLSYEAFYFAFVPLTLIMLGVRIARGSLPRLYWIPFFAFPLVQLLTLAFSRLFSLFVPLSVRELRPIRWELLDELGHNIVWLAWGLMHSAPNSKQLLLISVAMTLVLGIAVTLLILRPSTRSRGLAFAAILGGSISAIVIALFVYNLASYGMGGTGVMSRTTLSVSFWICLSLSVFLLCAEVSKRRRLLQPLSVAAVVMLMASFVPGFNKEHGVWKESWENSVRIMNKMPVDKIAKLPLEAVVVYIGPTDVGSLQSVDEFVIMAWSLLFHPETAIPLKVLKEHNLDTINYYSFFRVWNGEQVHARRYLVRTNHQKLHWDGNALHFSLPGHWKTEIPASKVYEWDQYRSTFREMAPSQPFGEPG